MSELSHDSVPITISARVDWMIFWSWAGLPGAFMDWQFITNTLNGRSERPGATFVGEDVAMGLEKLMPDASVLLVSFRNENEFVVSKIVVSKMIVDKFGAPQWKHSQLTFFKPQ